MTYASRKKGRLPLKDGENDSNEEQETSPEDDPLWESKDSINKERFCLEYSPQNWRVTTKADEDGEAAPNRVIWTYIPGRLNTVRIKATPTSDDRTSSSRYVVEKSNGNKTVTFYPPEPSFAAALELAQQIMRGCSGIRFSKLKQRLNISAAAWRVHARLNDWSDLEKITHNGRFDYIEGVDAKDNHRLWQAINGSFLEKSREEVTRVHDDDRTEGVYAIVPALGGWKVRKEWYCSPESKCDGLYGHVMLPLSEHGGRLYTDRDAAIDAAKAFTEDRIRTIEGSNHQFSGQSHSRADVPLLTGDTGQPSLFDFAEESTTDS